jgi:hypothetical protein
MWSLMAQVRKLNTREAYLVDYVEDNSKLDNLPTHVRVKSSEARM